MRRALAASIEDGSIDEIGRRLAALELLWIEAGAFMDPAVLADAARSIGDGLNGCKLEEATNRKGALKLSEDAQRRWEPTTMHGSLYPAHSN